MSAGLATLTNTVRANGTITALLGSDAGGPFVVAARICSKDWPLGTGAINIYMLSPIDLGIEYSEFGHTANCRAATEAEALQIAFTFADEINRASIDGGGRYYCNILPGVSPVDESDDWNVPVEVTIKTNQILS